MDIERKRARMRELVARLNETAHQYYVLDEPTISDAAWDALYDELRALEAETGEQAPDSPTRRVGGQPLAAFPEHRHIARLWSMDKVQSLPALVQWAEKAKATVRQWNETRARPLPAPSFYVEYKLDGLTVNLTYEGGRLVQAATRGDGEVGEAILPQARTIRAIPLTIPYQGRMEVQGECVMPLSQLAAYNRTAEEPLKNARNAAAGALRNLDPAVTAKRRLSAYFYQIGAIDDAPYHDQAGMLAFLRENGFPISPSVTRCDDAQSLMAEVARVEQARASLDVLIDGAVVKIGDLETREAFGCTDKFPRWAMAYKFAAEEGTSTLLDVTWEVGRTGKLTPLAHLAPVDIGGVTVRRATLNNAGDVKRKRVAIGCEVWLRRSNDVIPEIMGRVGDPRPDEREIVPPDRCPACGMPVVARGAHLFCTNAAGCKPQAVMRLSHFAGRNAMDIEGFSEKTAEQLYDALGVRDPADLYTLELDALAALPGFQRKRAENLLAAIDRSRTRPLDAFLFALGIPNVGRKTARDIAEAYGTLAAARGASRDSLLNLPDIGDVVADSVVAYFAEPRDAAQIDRLLAAGVKPVERAAGLSGADASSPSEPQGAPLPFAGMRVVVTGTLQTLSREEAERLVAARGGAASGSVSKRTTFVVAGEKAGSKREKALALGVPVIDEDEFLRRANGE